MPFRSDLTYRRFNFGWNRFCFSVDSYGALILGRKELEPHPSEDVINDGFGVADVGMVRESRRFETDVREFIRQNF